MSFNGDFDDPFGAGRGGIGSGPTGDGTLGGGLDIVTESLGDEFSSQNQASSSGVFLSGGVSGRPGEVTFEAELERVSRQAIDVGVPDFPTEWKLIIEPERRFDGQNVVSQARSFVRGRVRELESFLGLIPGSLESLQGWPSGRSPEIIPSELDARLSASANLQGGTYSPSNPLQNSLDQISSDGFSISKTFTFPTLKIPVVDLPESELGERLEGVPSRLQDFDEQQLPNIPVTIRAEPQGFLRGQARQADLSFTVFISPTAYVEKVRIETLDCESLFPEIPQRIEGLKADIEGRLSSVESARAELRGIDTNLSSRFNVDSIEDLRPRNIAELGVSRAQSIRSRVRDVSLERFEPESLEDRIESLRDGIEDVAIPACTPDFRGRLEGLQEQLSEFRDILNDATDLKERLLNLLEDVQDIDCEEVYSQLNEQVRSVEETVGIGRFDALIDSTITQSDFIEERENINSAIETVENRLERTDPCRERFVGRLESARTKLAEFRDATGCAERFPEAAEIVEEEINQFRPLGQLDPGQRENFLSRVRSSKDEVDELLEDAGECRQQLLGRLNDLEQDLETAGVRLPGISDIPRELRSGVNALVGEVNQFLERDPLAREPDRRDELLSEARRLRRRVRGEVSDDNRAKGQLLSQLSTAIADLTQAAVREAAALPCRDRFPEVRSELDQFRNRVLNAEPPLTPEELQSIAREGERVISQIRGRAGGSQQCSSEFIGEARSLVQRAQSLTSRVRVQTQTAEQARDESQQIIDNLIGSLDQLQAANRERVEERVGEATGQ